LAVFFLANDVLIDHSGPSQLSRIDGLVLVLFFTIFIVYTFGISREKQSILDKAIGEMEEGPKEYNIYTSISMIIAGIAGLTLGGRWIVNGAISFAQIFGISETLIGLTIVAVGTSLPELAASAVAAHKGKTDIAVGNVVGSNIFNMLWVLGLASTIHPIAYESELNIDFGVLFFLTILLLVLIYVGKKNILARWEGVTLLGVYVLYIIFLVIRG